MSTNFNFIREIRTPYSEAYSLFIDENEDIDGRLDIHYLENNNVSALLSLFKTFSEDQILILLEAIDDQIVNMADIDKGNFYIEVNTVTNRNAFGTNVAEV